MATSRSQYAACWLVKDRTLMLKTEADHRFTYSGVVVIEDTLLVIDRNAMNLQLYSRRDGKLLYTSHRLKSDPMSICLISKTEVALCLEDSTIVIMSFKSIDDIKLVKTLDVNTTFDKCHSVAKVNSDKLVASGWQDYEVFSTLSWCVVNLEDGLVDCTHEICEGYHSHLAIKDNTVYISCQTGKTTTNCVYAYDIFNPHTRKVLYRHRKWTPCSIMVDRRNFIYVCDEDSNSIHQLTDSGQLVTIHTVSSSPYEIFYDDKHGVLYTTSRKYRNEITVYRLEYLYQPGIPEEIVNMDDRSIQLFEEALKDGKETVYSLRIMVVGHLGVGKTTLVKRLLGEGVNISERCSTEGIDVYVNCCDVSLSTCEWTRRGKDSEQDYRLQRLARVLIEQHSVKDKVTHEEQVIIPPQGETTQKIHEGVHIAGEGKKSEVLYSRSPQQVIGQGLSSTARQQEEFPPPAFAQGEPIQSEINTTAMLKLLQENAYKFKQDTDKTAAMSVWDFAGQFAFYTTHQTFLTRRAIYLLVSDVSQQLTDLVSDDCYLDSEGMMKCKVHELIEVWLNSIHSCTPFPEAGMPPVILVGTHVDKISQKQSPAKGTEPETPTKKLETIEFTPHTTTTKEQLSAATFLGALKKVFKPLKTKGIVRANPVSSIKGASVLPAVEQPKPKRKWRFKQRTRKEEVDAETDMRYLAGSLPNIVQEFIVDTDDYSTPGGVDFDNNQQMLIALYNFSSIYSNQLSFSKGDKLRLIGKSDPRWWQAGNSLGEVGLVPSEYMHVQICLADNLPNIAQDVIGDTGDCSTPTGVDVDNSQEILIALYNFTPIYSNQLSFSRGDKLILIRKSDPEWWQARNSLGEEGLVPSRYMQVQGYSYKMCEKYFREIRSCLRDKPTRFHLVNEDFAINNTIVDPRVEALKRKIVEVASQQPYWGEEIPARWIPLEQELMKLKSAGIKVIPWSLLEDINKALAVQMTTDELDLFLRFQHDIGTILYFSMEILKEKIVLDPKWMIDALKSLITAQMFVLRNMPAVTDKWFEFKEKGKLSLELVDAVWTKQKHPDLHDNKGHILLLMEQLNIIAKLRIYSEEASEIKEENCFLAPCMLHQKTPREVIFPEPHPQMGSSSVLCYVFMGKYLPSPIFHRLLAACVAHWPIATKKKENAHENLIFCGCCVFQPDHYHKLTIHFRDYIIFIRVTRKGITDKTPSSKLCIEVREFVTAMLTRIIGCLSQSLKFEHFIQCPEYTGDSINSLIPVSRLKENAEVCCELHDNIIESKKLLKFWFKDMQKMEPCEQIHSCASVLTSLGECQVSVQTRALPPGKKYHIFFSYCSSDIQWVKETVERLEKVHGFVCREYDRDNTPGTPLFKFADDSISNAYKTVVVMTREAFQSGFVLHEIDMAITQGFDEKRKCVVPVLLKDCEVPRHLRILNYVDVRDPNMRDTWWPKLLMELETQETLGSTSSDTVMKEIHIQVKRKHIQLCLTLYGLISEDSFKNIKQMAEVYLDRKTVEKAKNMRDLWFYLEEKGVIGEGKYDKLLEIMTNAGVGIAIDLILQTANAIKDIMHNLIPAEEQSDTSSQDTRASDQDSSRRSPEMTTEWNFTIKDLQDAWQSLEVYLSEELHPNCLLIFFEKERLLSADECEDMYKLRRRQVVKELLQRIKAKLPEAFLSFLYALNETRQQVIVQGLKQLIEGIAVPQPSTHGQETHAVAYYTLTMELSKDGNTLHETESKTRAYMDKGCMVFYFEMRSQCFKLESGSVIVYLRPLGKLTKERLDLFCQHGGMKNFLLDLLKKKDIFPSLPGGEISIHIQVCCYDKDDSEDADGDTQMVSEHSVIQVSFRVTDSFIVTDKTEVIKQNLINQYEYMIEEIEPLNFKDTFVSRGILDASYFEKLKMRIRRKERATDFLNEVLVKGNAALEALVHDLRDSGLDDLVRRLCIAPEKDEGQVDDGLIEVIREDSASLESMVFVVRKNEDGDKAQEVMGSDEGIEKNVTQKTSTELAQKTGSVDEMPSSVTDHTAHEECQKTLQRRSLPPGKKYHAFFSYSSSDIQWVKQTVKRLESDYGFICCEYDRDNTPGTPLLKFAEDSIRNAYKTVVVMTCEAFQSGFVLLEVDMAIRQGLDESRKCVVPVLLNDCEIPLHLKILNYVDVQDTERMNIWLPKLVMELET